MEEAVVGSVIGATIQVVLQNLLSISVDEFNLFRGFKKDLKKLKDSFLMTQDFLYDAEMQHVINRAVKRWLKELESVAFEADNALDEISYQVLRNKMETQNGIKKKLQAFNFRQKMAHKVRDINEKSKLINKKARGFGLQIMRSAGAGFDANEGRETDSFAADPIVVGREDDVSRIVDMLTTDPPQQAFSVLPIVGMGGLGKTTLARQVFSHEKIKTHFAMQIWVYVSRTFDVVSIFKKILESLTIENKIELENRESVLRKIQEYLGHKRYLLVLDDVWNDDRVKWDDFFDSLSGISSVMGNGIIVTTRGENIASIVKTLPIHKLESLSEDNCWSIIKAKAFGGGAVPSEFETIGRKIANKCQGLPLAAKVVGGFLREKSKNEWLSFEETWLSNFGQGESTILNTLKFSFDHLPSPSLKKCFAYCSIFPKGFRKEREELIELWMAEGFLITNDMETVGNRFFNLLVQNSLLQVVDRDSYGNITFCNMHDLVHDLASSVLGSKSICMNEESLHDIHQVRYIGVESIRGDSFTIPNQQARYVRTLILESKVSDDMFSNFESLHVLVLMSKDVTELPSSIKKLKHLRLLDISHTRIECLPKSIGKLYHLQTLRAGFYLRTLPDTLKNLTCLRHLHIDDIELPPEIGKLTSLQTLPYLQVGSEKGCRIGELGSLKYLKGKLEISNLERVNDKDEAKSARLFEKANIFKLKFVWDERRNGATNDENVLEGLQPHPNLKSLEISGFKGVRFPSWTLKMEGLNNLMEIRLTSCGESEELPTLGHLRYLKSLYLDGLANVRSIGSSFYGIHNLITSTSNGEGRNEIVLFPALKRLELKEMSNLREWLEVEFSSGAETQPHEISVFPRLEHLLVYHCPELTSIPYPSGGQPHEGFSSLRNLSICYCKGLTNLPSEMIESCASSLESLCLRGLINLRNLSVVMKMPRLTSLEIVHVPKITVENVSLPSLQSLRIGSSSYSLVRELLNDIFKGSPSLRSLYLCGMEHWDSLPDQLQHLCALSDLFLINFGIEALPEWLGNMSSLRSIGLLNCKKLRRLPSKEAMQRLTKLSVLDIWNCPQLNVNSQWPQNVLLLY